MMEVRPYQICTRCVMDTSDINIHFDSRGVCDRCNQFQTDILPEWNYGENHQQELDQLVSKIKQQGKGHPYDCILGLSGGLDSSYMLHVAVKELGLRPLVFHVDAGWNTGLAVNNIQKMVSKLGLDLKIETITWEEVRDFQLAFFKSGVPHLDIAQDHAFVAVLDQYAKKYKIKYILNGGNISTEVVVNPNAWGYWGTDLKHIRDILKRFGTIKMKTYPFTSIIQRKVIMPYIHGIKIVKLLNYMPYEKSKAEAFLHDEYGWQAYPQKHFESILTKFIEGYWLPKRFGYDVRRPQFSSLILTGRMTREQALEYLAMPPIPSEEAEELFGQVAGMLQIPQKELQQYMEVPKKSYKDYANSEWMFTIGAKILYTLKIDKLLRK